jgi:predicted HTH transcriptional regulator
MQEPLFSPNEKQSRILIEVRATGPLTRSELATTLGCSQREADNAISGLIVAGALRATTDNHTFELGAEAPRYMR